MTDLPRHQTYGPFRFAVDPFRRVRLLTDAKVSEIFGRRRVEGVEIQRGGASERIDCDTVVFTGGWIPDHELARMGGLAIDSATLGPAVDFAFRTSRPGVFAAGNLLHGAEMADRAALEGRRAAQSVVAFLSKEEWSAFGPAISVDPPLAWIVPSRIGLDPLPRSRLVLQTRAFVDDGTLEVRQGDRSLHAQRVGTLIPNRSIYLPSAWIPSIRRDGGPLSIGIRT